jgi:ABC-type multidrug transport system fused ATPase/permease subunit
MLSQMLFLWNNALIQTGYRRPLQREDVWAIRTDMSTELAAGAFAATGAAAEAAAGRRWSLLRGVYIANRRDFWVSALYRAGQELAQLVQPLLLARILHFLEDEAAPLREGLGWSVALFCAACMKTLLENHYFITCVRCGIRARAVCIDLIFRKALRLSVVAKNEQSTGKIMNLMQIDAQKFYDTSWGLHLVWAAVLQIGGCVVLLFTVLGPAMLAGLALILVLIPVNGCLVKRQHTRRKQASRTTDDRVSVINEVVQSIRTLKLFAWEEHFAARIGARRLKELRMIRQLGTNKAMISTLATITPSLVTLVSLLWYTLISGEQLTVATVFTSIALFENMKDPLSRLSDRITSFVDLAVATRRIEDFLAGHELLPSRHDKHQRPIARDSSQLARGAIQIEQSSFSWEVLLDLTDRQINPRAATAPLRHCVCIPLVACRYLTCCPQQHASESIGISQSTSSKGGYAPLGQHELQDTYPQHGSLAPPPVPHLRDIIFRTAPGSLVYVIGTTGAGKSSFLAAVLGEISELTCASGGSTPPVAAAAQVGGQVAFVPQTSWILNMSLKRNVTITGLQRRDSAEEQERRYREALWASGLDEDLANLPAGDETEIGVPQFSTRYLDS